jgi:hypothetical protein
MSLGGDLMCRNVVNFLMKNHEAVAAVSRLNKEFDASAIHNSDVV